MPSRSSTGIRVYRLYDRWLRPGKPGHDPFYTVKCGLHAALSLIGGRRFKQTLASRAIDYDGHSVRIDAQDTLRILSGRPFDPAEMVLLADLLHPGDVAIDVGANIGIYTLAMARQVGSTGRVHAFEPYKENADLLGLNVVRNGYSGFVTLHRAAVADKAGTARLAINTHNAGMHRLAKEGSAEVETVCLDDLFAGQRVDFVKIDVEGAEVAVLRGMRGILAANPDISLLVEYNRSGLEAFGNTPDEMFAELGGFTCHLAGRPDEVGRETLDHATRLPGACANLLFVRRERCRHPCH